MIERYRGCSARSATKPFAGRAFLTNVLVFVLAASTGLVAAQDDSRQLRSHPVGESLHRVSEAATPGALETPTGRMDVIVRLSEPPISAAGDGSAASRIDEEQQLFLDRCLSAIPSARVLARVRASLNAVFLSIDAQDLQTLRDDPAVSRVAEVGRYELSLSETVPYIGASAVQDRGIDGDGVSVAVFDSGIDYTHAAFGGAGTIAAYNDEIADTSIPITFPSAKVPEGFDFTGDVWPTGPLAPDADPIDLDGHGTHVADIIGGENGVAPGVELWAVKVCSSVSTSCSGVALIQGMDFALDPDGDGHIDDRVDIINMSLGASYGQPFDDDLSAAVDNATKVGVMTVAASGNAADKPYAHATPASAKTALAVAQTTVPSAFQQFMEVIEPAAQAGNYDAVFQNWAGPLTDVISGTVEYGEGGTTNLNGCAPFTTDLSGKIVLVDRGACNFTLKILNIQQAGGALGIIGLIEPGGPFSGGDGGDGPITIPAYMIDLATADLIRSGGVVEFDPANTQSLAGSMVSSSSRGPTFGDNRVKPEIGAPGASVSATVGTGDGTSPFGGTSGASPMVAGSAALLKSAYHHASPLKIKAMLMNSAETDILNTIPGDTAPVTRIGAGEVRVDRSLYAPAIAWDVYSHSGALSFGFVDVSHEKTLWRLVAVKNISHRRLRFKVSTTFRDPADEALGAVKIRAPHHIRLWPYQTRYIWVKMTIDAEKLLPNSMTSGIQGADPSTLTLNEFDGQLRFDGYRGSIHLPWQVLPRKAAKVRARRVMRFDATGLARVRLRNRGAGDAQNEAFSLLGLSPDIPEGGQGEQMPTPDLRAVGVNTFGAGFCSAGWLWEFAINTHERQSHSMPVSFWIYFDIDQDGVDDWIIINRDLSLNNVTDGRNASWSVDARTFAATPLFFTRHPTNSGVTILTLCGEHVGLSLSDVLTTNVNVRVEATDFYFGGPGDVIDNLTITPLGERYVGTVVPDIPGHSSDTMEVRDFGPFPGNSAELGLLLVTAGDRGAGNRGGATEKTESLLFFAGHRDRHHKHTDDCDH